MLHLISQIVYRRHSIKLVELPVPAPESAPASMVFFKTTTLEAESSDEWGCHHGPDDVPARGRIGSYLKLAELLRNKRVLVAGDSLRLAWAHTYPAVRSINIIYNL